MDYDDYFPTFIDENNNNNNNHYDNNNNNNKMVKMNKIRFALDVCTGIKQL